MVDSVVFLACMMICLASLANLSPHQFPQVTNNPGGRFEDFYTLQDAELGKGQFSTVKRAIEISTQREVSYPTLPVFARVNQWLS
jgi:hypothetical protein